MKRSHNTMAIMAINAIRNNGSTLEQAAKHAGCCSATLRKCLKEHYKKQENYEQILRIAARNKRLQKQAQALISDENLSVEEAPTFEDSQKEVIVTETGYLLTSGVETIVGTGLDIYVPAFCINKEMRKLSNSNADAEEFLTLYWSTHMVTTINLQGKEELYVTPTFPIKERSKGVVAVAVELLNLGYKVRLYTNSHEIENLALMQGDGIDVVYTGRSKKAV